MRLGKLQSAFGGDRRHCLCKVLKPLLKMCRLFGLFPVRHNEETCTMSHSWVSLPALVNITWFFVITFLSFVLYSRASSLLQKILVGTDFYTFSIVFVAESSASSFIFLAGSFNAPHFSMG